MKEIRNYILKFRATEEEKDRIMKKVDASDLSISEYLRRCALEKQIVAVNGLDDVARELLERSEIISTRSRERSIPDTSKRSICKKLRRC